MKKQVAVLVGAGSIGQAIIRRVSAGKHVVLAETEIIHVGHKDIRGCIGCYKCRELGHCIFDKDMVNEAAQRRMVRRALRSRFIVIPFAVSYCKISSMEVYWGLRPSAS